MSAWSMPKCHISPAKLTDIMSEQAILSFESNVESSAEEPSLSDYELALRLQFADEAYDNEAADFELAQCLSAMEEPSNAFSYNSQPSDTLMYSKVTIKSTTEWENNFRQKRPMITSSSFNQAIHQGRKVEHLEEEKLNYIVTHDPLLSALSTSKSLSELEGVGDLCGNGFLVNKSVAHPLRSFMHQQEKQKTESTAQIKNKKKNKK